jgi:hypothetical protein
MIYELYKWVMSWFRTEQQTPLLDPREIIEEEVLPIGIEREIRLNQLRRQVAHIPIRHVPMHVADRPKKRKLVRINEDFLENPETGYTAERD